QARQQALGVMERVLGALQRGDIHEVGRATTDNFFGPIQSIVPWASTRYTEELISQVQAALGADFWGFWMLGGMSGGGMGFIVAPARKAEAQRLLQEIMSATKKKLENALPFAMEPVVYDFAINEQGTCATLRTGDDAMMPPAYYGLMVPAWTRRDVRELSPGLRADMERFGLACRQNPAMVSTIDTIFHRLIPQGTRQEAARQNLSQVLAVLGFDPLEHEQIRTALKAGRLGLAQNRLPDNTLIEDVRPEDVVDTRARGVLTDEHRRIGAQSLAAGEVAVVSLAAGVGSRWTQGAGVVKALHPFCKLGGGRTDGESRHRSFLEVHLAKSRKINREFGGAGGGIPHLVTTSWLTHDPIASFLKAHENFGYCIGGKGGASGEEVILSPGRAVGLRLVPMVRDLRFAWEEMPQQVLDAQKQKMRDSLRSALLGWAQQCGEGSDYTDNLPGQCLHPVGHWYEIPNLLRNGVLTTLLARRPNLKHLMLHNIDTLGANVDPAILGLHIQSGKALSFEVIARRIEDRGGGLARIDGRVRLLEGLAMPREEDEFGLSFYNSMTTWIDIDQLLGLFGLDRQSLANPERVATAVRQLAQRMPTYITLKDVKKRWGQGQEDIFPVTQFEKLWGDMTALPEARCGFLVVERRRGQQLKDQAQLDGWYREGNAAYLEALCDWGNAEC
ncbi:MAG: UTP--glucose-1-phosphate uridylyltransferase, partial [Phycisphaerae bacterium]